MRNQVTQEMGLKQRIAYSKGIEHRNKDRGTLELQYFERCVIEAVHNRLGACTTRT